MIAKNINDVQVVVMEVKKHSEEMDLPLNINKIKLLRNRYNNQTWN